MHRWRERKWKKKQQQQQKSANAHNYVISPCTPQFSHSIQLAKRTIIFVIKTVNADDAKTIEHQRSFASSNLYAKYVQNEAIKNCRYRHYNVGNLLALQFERRREKKNTTINRMAQGQGREDDRKHSGKLDYESTFSEESNENTNNDAKTINISIISNACMATSKHQNIKCAITAILM